jgi:DNA-binding transcriptional regulator YiaG
MPSIILFLGYDPQPPAQTFPELIHRTRRTLGLTQPGIANVLKVPLPTLRAWEQGLYEPNKERRRSVEKKLQRILSGIGHNDG